MQLKDSEKIVRFVPLSECFISENIEKIDGFGSKVGFNTGSY